MRFKIPVVLFTELTCPIYEPPENGALVINYFDSDPLCQVQCKRGYDFVTIPPQLYVCGSGVWGFIDFFKNADTSLPWPDCAREYHMFYYYQYTRPNRKSASSKHTLSGPQKTDSGLLMHYQPYS